MGRESTVTAEQVHTAADALKAEGINPSLRAVRVRLGTGSLGTINPFLQDWKASQERHTAAALTMPPALQRAILDFIADELSAVRAPLAIDLAEQKQAADDLGAESERQREIIEYQATQLAQLATEKAASEGRAAQLADDMASANENAISERRATEAARTELAKSQLRLESMPRLEADLDALRAELATVKQACNEAEQRAAVLGAQKADLEARLNDAKQDAERGRAQLASTQDDAARERQAAETVRAELAKAEQKAAVLGVQKTDLETRLIDAKQDAERDREQWASAKDEAEQLKRSLNARIEDLVVQITAANRDVDRARAAAKAPGKVRSKLAKSAPTNA